MLSIEFHRMKQSIYGGPDLCHNPVLSLNPGPLFEPYRYKRISHFGDPLSFCWTYCDGRILCLSDERDTEKLLRRGNFDRGDFLHIARFWDFICDVQFWFICVT